MINTALVSRAGTCRQTAFNGALWRMSETGETGDDASAGRSPKHDDSVRSIAEQRRVLIVDDDPLVRERLVHLVQAAGFDCAAVESGAAALDALREDYRPILITDRMMPGVDGLELSRLLRRDEPAGYIYILMLTVRDSADDLVSGFDAGVDDYLSKNASEGELIARLYAAQRRIALESSLRASEERYRDLALTLEERVTERTVELRSLVAELESFSYSISHHLRAPLRHISAAAHLLRDIKSVARSHAAERRISQIISAAHALGRLIDDLLSFTALRARPVQATPFALEGLVAEVRAQLTERRVGRTVEWRSDPLPDIEGDPALLRQVWTDLIDNALKFTSVCEEPRIEIRAQLEPDRWIFRVIDNGVGFDMRFRDKLFTPLNRLHGPTEFEGNGMGLARVKRIVELHGGAVWAQGEENVGATFAFSLPRRRGAPSH